MFCKNCGIQLEDGMKFCKQCGTPTGIASNQEKVLNPEVDKPIQNVPLQTAPAQTIQTAPVKSTPALNSSNNKKLSNKKSPKILIMLISFILLLAVGSFFLLKTLNKSDDSKDKDTIDTVSSDTQVMENDSKSSSVETSEFVDGLKDTIDELKDVVSTKDEKTTESAPIATDEIQNTTDASSSINAVDSTDTFEASNDPYTTNEEQVADTYAAPPELPVSEPVIRHEYQFIQMDLSWEEAQEYCLSLGGHLATITSEEEQLYIEENLDSSIAKVVMLGSTNYTMTGNYEWLTGEEFTYSKWMEGEPNNEGDVEHFLYMYYIESKGGWVWNDAPDDVTEYYAGKIWVVCEWDIEE